MYAFNHISSFGQIAQWLERVHGKHEVLGSNPSRFKVVISDPLHTECSNLTEARWA